MVAPKKKGATPVTLGMEDNNDDHTFFTLRFNFIALLIQSFRCEILPPYFSASRSHSDNLVTVAHTLCIYSLCISGFVLPAMNQDLSTLSPSIARRIHQLLLWFMDMQLLRASSSEILMLSQNISG
ncbi:unnamed protein product [Lactuca saligna]|uniref:Uncharacterized protein n=1 Tax=Lactuca saligna TaxID=75948 RepID=A0AA36EAA4_LACSI|nr:unnamed protein product [Lactuca saligna]